MFNISLINCFYYIRLWDDSYDLCRYTLVWSLLPQKQQNCSNEAQSSCVSKENAFAKDAHWISMHPWCSWTSLFSSALPITMCNGSSECSAHTTTQTETMYSDVNREIWPIPVRRIATIFRIKENSSSHTTTTTTTDVFDARHQFHSSEDNWQNTFCIQNFMVAKRLQLQQLVWLNVYAIESDKVSTIPLYVSVGS